MSLDLGVHNKKIHMSLATVLALSGFFKKMIRKFGHIGEGSEISFINAHAGAYTIMIIEEVGAFAIISTADRVELEKWTFRPPFYEDDFYLFFDYIRKN